MRRRICWFVLILALSPLLSHAGEGESLREIREIGTILKAAEQGSSIENAVVHGLDFQQTPIMWQKIDVSGAVFLGCKFGGNDESMLVRRGALVYPGFHNLPYNPYRSILYTPAELFATRGDNDSRTLDQQIYGHYAKRGRYGPNVMDALAQRIHDHAIDRALAEFLDIDETGTPRRKVVAIMGGHSTRRDDPCYRKVALLACSLARQGYLVSTGGGPGMMEAGNLGAYLADYGKEAVEDAVTTLAMAPDGKSPGYYERVEEVLKKYSKGKDSLAIPTWFYGQEPCNIFGTRIAKYFSNAIREETLLATATCGVVFTPGSAGTTQEVFMTAAQNHYGSFGYYCPMVFLGKKRYAEETKIYDLLKELAKGREYEKFMAISDDPDELVEFIKAHPPQKVLQQ
jgi:predicted Rossmann-fold nucleotide-binding protein